MKKPGRPGTHRGAKKKTMTREATMSVEPYARNPGARNIFSNWRIWPGVSSCGPATTKRNHGQISITTRLYRERSGDSTSAWAAAPRVSPPCQEGASHRIGAREQEITHTITRTRTA